MENKKQFLYANMHDFKTNLARYVAALENGHTNGIILQRNGKRVAALIPAPADGKREESRL